LVAQIARALTEAHSAGVIHRDLKPANVFLTRDEDGGLLVKLLDFGIARTMQTHRVMPPFSTAPGLIFGTPGYMSPEQAFLPAEVDHRCDLWALGTIAYEALTGELPVTGAHTQELLANLCAGRIVAIHDRNPGLPGPVGAFFARVFAPDITARFASPGELSRAFDRAIQQPPRGPVDRSKVTPDLVKGNTLSITLPMRSPRPSGESSGRPGARRGTRSRLFVLSAALLAGTAALGTAWRALALRAPPPAMETARPTVEAAGDAFEPTSPRLAQATTTISDPAGSTDPPPEAAAEPAAPAVPRKLAPQPMTIPIRQAAPPSATSIATQWPSPPAPRPLVAPRPPPSSSARATEDPSGVL
ncbi:MAG TPA: protein kinase, partial [Gemmatimonadales bacterium]|nr:protein kinase [Gemmatimonadales bacterium]